MSLLRRRQEEAEAERQAEEEEAEREEEEVEREAEAEEEASPLTRRQSPPLYEFLDSVESYGPLRRRRVIGSQQPSKQPRLQARPMAAAAEEEEEKEEEATNDGDGDGDGDAGGGGGRREGEGEGAAPPGRTITRCCSGCVGAARPPCVAFSPRRLRRFWRSGRG